MRTPSNSPHILAAALIAGLAAGCTGLAPMVDKRRPPAHEHLEYLARAINASSAARELMWREEAVHGSSQESQLRRALLRSVPGSARFHPAKAEAELRALLQHDVPIEIASVARTRLDALQTLDCREQVDVLKKRLSKVADIERDTTPPETNPPGSDR